MSGEIELKTHKYDINIKLEEYFENDGINAGFLKLKISGKDIYVKLINSLRRCVQTMLPTYAIPPELITIVSNTTNAYNNDYMRSRLCELPVLGIECGLSYLEDKYWRDIKYDDVLREKHEDEKNIELYVNVVNRKSEKLNVTTNDIKIIVNGEMISPYNKDYPILIIKLREGEKFECMMKAVLGVGLANERWGHANNSYYSYDDKTNTCILTVEGNQQCNEYNILVKACKCLITKLTNIKNDFKKKLESKEITEEKRLDLYLKNENHTIGEILNYELQSNKNILLSGITKPDYLIDEILIKIESTGSVKSPFNAIFDSIDELIKKYSHIGKLINDLNGSYIYKKKSKVVSDTETETETETSESETSETETSESEIEIKKNKSKIIKKKK